VHFRDGSSVGALCQSMARGRNEDDPALGARSNFILHAPALTGTNPNATNPNPHAPTNASTHRPQTGDGRRTPLPAPPAGQSATFTMRPRAGMGSSAPGSRVSGTRRAFEDVVRYRRRVRGPTNSFSAAFGCRHERVAVGEHLVRLSPSAFALHALVQGVQPCLPEAHRARSESRPVPISTRNGTKTKRAIGDLLP
jgi:hypothetical protein